MPTPTTRHSRAEISTSAPARDAEQLVSHLSRTIEMTIDGDAWTARLGEATGHVVVGDGVLVLTALGADQQSLAEVEDVPDRHLERFGVRDELTVTWVHSSVERP